MYETIAHTPRLASFDEAARGRGTWLGARALLAALVALVIAGVSAGPASAGTVRPLADTFGSFGDPSGFALHAASDSLYVVDRSDSSVRKFDVGGGSPVPADFSSLGSPRLDGGGVPDVGSFAFDSPSGLAVDQSGGVTDGYLYVVNGAHGAVEVFDASGAFVGRITETPAGGLSGPMGVAVDGVGNVFVASAWSGSVDKFDSTVAVDDVAAYLGSVTGPDVGNPAGVAVDSTGQVYVTQMFGATSKFADAQFTPDPEADIGVPVDMGAGIAVAVNPADDHLFIDRGSEIVEYDPAGTQVGRSSQGFGSSTGLAVDGTNDLLYVADAQNTRGVVLGPGVEVDAPAVTTGAPSDVTSSSAHLTGSVDPGGSSQLSLTSWRFEYSTDAGGSWTPLADHGPIGGGSRPVAEDLGGLAPNQEVWVRLVATNAADTTTSDPVEVFTTDPAPPILDGAAPFASAITSTTATLNGTVNPNNSPTAYRFEYVTDTQYQVDGFASATNTPVGDAGSTIGDQTVSADITGLEAGALYHFRLVANNGTGGDVQGSEATFATAPDVPAGATDVTADAATLIGTIDSHGSAVSYRFEYGKTTAYGKATPLVANAPPTDGEVTTAISGLEPSTTYHVRVLATVNGQTATGPDGTFETLPAPSVTIAEATDITTTAVTLHANADTNGLAGSYTFTVTATDSPYVTTTPPAAVPADGVLSARVEGLPAGEGFTVQANVTAAGVTRHSAQASFATLPPAPYSPPATEPDLGYPPATKPPATRPPNRFRFRLVSSTTGKGRRGRLTLTFPRPGTVAITHRYLKPVRRTVQAGKATIRLTLNKAGRRALRKSHKPRRTIAYTVRYAPESGAPATRRATLTFKRKATR
jgi:sugar lactone lactonase YvrE